MHVPLERNRQRTRPGTWIGISVLAAAVLMAVPVLADPPSGGGIVLSRQVIASGGGRATSATLELVGTIGQAEAGPPATGGTYRLQGGFHAPFVPPPPLPDPVFRDGFE